MDLKRQELRRLCLPPQQGRSPPPPRHGSRMLPDFYLSLHLSPVPLPPLSRCFFNATRGDHRLPDPGVPICRWVGGGDNGKGPNALFSAANAKSLGRLCSVLGPAHCNCNTNYLFMKRPCCRAAAQGLWQRSGLYPLPAGLLRTSVPSLQHSVSSGSCLSVGKVQDSRSPSPVLSAGYFFLGIAEDVKPSPGSGDSSLRASGARGVLVRRCTPLFLSVPTICSIGVSVRVCVHAYMYVFVLKHECINTQVLKGELCLTKIKKMLTNAHKAKPVQCMKTRLLR